MPIARATLYRRRNKNRATRTGDARDAEPQSDVPKSRAKSHRALTEVERDRVLKELGSDRFIDVAPAEVYATLLDEGVYLCSVSTK